MSHNIILKQNKGYRVVDEVRHEVDFNYNFDAMKRIIGRMDYRGTGLIKDQSVEYMKGLPPIGGHFYEFIINKQFPNPDIFLKKVISEHFDSSPDGETLTLRKTGVEYSYEGVKGRVLRMFPSLLRDYIFFVLCTISGEFDSVEYSLELDWTYGYDLLIEYKGQKFGIALFTDTNRGNSFKAEKGGRRRRTLPDVTEIIIKINPFETSKRIGKYALYDMQDVHYLKREIDKILA